MEEKLEKALLKLQAACARREYCTSDVMAKALGLTDGDTEAAQTLVGSLKKDGFVNDSRYAAAFAREKSSITGWGQHKISNALRLKGLDRDTIEAAMNEIDAGKAETKLRKLIEGKWKSLKEDPYGKFKLLRYTLARGYDYDTVRDIVEETVSAGARDDT